MYMRPGIRPGSFVWNEFEDELVRLLYPNAARLHHLMPWRTREAIRRRAGALNLTRECRPWTGVEIKKLRRLVADGVPWADTAEHLPGRTVDAIKEQAKQLKLQRPHAKLKDVPNELIHALRVRTLERGLTPAKVDRMAGTGTWFRCMGPAHCDTYEPKMEFVARVAAVLGGQIKIEWSDAHQRRAPQRTKPREDPIIEAIRQRAHQLNLTGADVDALLPYRKRYRRPRTWWRRGARPFNWRYVHILVKAMDGRFVVEWNR